MGEVEITEPEAYGVDDRATATATGAVVDDEDDVNERVLEWEMGLPNCDDLTPLSQSLIPPELASAFSISPETRRTAVDVNRASQNTLSSLRSTGAHSSNNINNDNNKNFRCLNEPMVVEPERDGSGSGSATEPKKMRKMASPEEADSAVRTTMENSEDPSRGKALKRHRLVWTPQLHKRFVDVVAHLGIKNAVPKTIMQLMNVDGLTRENVASHLQKYRLYLKRMQGQSDEGPSASDQLFASTPVPQSLRENGTSVGGGSVNSSGHVGMAIPMPYGTPMIPMPMYRPAHHHHQNGYEANSYGMMQQRDWSGGNKFGSFVSYPPHRMAPNEKLH